MENKSALASLTTYRDSDISDEEDDVPRDKSGSASPPLGPTPLEAESSPGSIHEIATESVTTIIPEPTLQNTTQNSNPKALSKLVSYNEEDLDKEDDEDYSPNSDYDVEMFTAKFDDEKSTSGEAMQSLSRSVLHLAPDDIKLPAEPPGRCSNHLQEKISRYYQRKLKEGLDMNVVIQHKKMFRNPSIYEKLISFCGIDELGTNYPPEIYDPHRWGEESLYEELAKAQKIDMDKRQKEKTKVEFILGTKKSTDSALDEAKKRKSKWDMGAASQALPIPAVIKPAGLVSAAPGIVTMTTTATGTKPTVISAFGTISKKPKV